MPRSPTYSSPVDGFGIEGTEFRSDQVLSSSGSSLGARASGENGTTYSTFGCPEFRQDN